MAWDNPELYERAKICALNGHTKGVRDLIKQMSNNDLERFTYILSLAKQMQCQTPTAP